MATLKINNSDMPEPTTLQWDISDLDSDTSGRNALGEMLRDRVAVKRKLTLEWSYLSPTDMSKLLNAVKEMYFNCTYPDAQTGGFVTKTFYVGDRSAPAYRIDSNKAYWTGLSMNFIEK